MSDKEKKPTIRWLEKLRNIKHIEIYVAIIFIVIVLLIFLPNRSTNDDKKSTTNEMTVTAFIDNMEKDLEEILSNISGVSNVNVMISLNLSDLEVENNKINMVTFPKINGILVTAKGVNDTAIKMKVLHAIESVVDVTNGNIEILSSE